MSFSYNPYMHIEVIRSDRFFRVHCHSCGWDGPVMTGNVTVDMAFEVMADHVQHSHARTKEDFTGWSSY